MKIMFLSADLRPGKDGVGDYCRRLACELTRRGHNLCILALNERETKQVVKEDFNGVSVLRLPEIMSWSKRKEIASAFIREVSPDIVSLQFVLYGWSRKGLPFFWVFRFPELLKGQVVHVMLHELYLGIWLNESIKRRLIGFAQRQIIKSLMRSIDQVVLVSTSIPAYVEVCHSIGIDAKQLPLFGNIECGSFTYQQFEDFWGGRIDVPYPELFIVGAFGAIKHDIFSSELLESVVARATAMGKMPVIAIAGGVTAIGENYFDKVAVRYGDLIRFINVGRLSESEVSCYMQSLDFGLSTTPWLYVRKSGAVAAMLEHGLPVIVSSDEISIRNIESSPVEIDFIKRIKLLGSPDFVQWFNSALKVTKRNLVSEVADRIEMDYALLVAK